MKRIASILLAIAALASCTENQRAKSWGGTAKVEVPRGQKVIGATWKEEDLWYLTRPMHADEQPETLTLQEQSSFGLVQGAVVFQESR